MLLQIRTKDDLVELLGAGISHAWRVAESRLDKITNVEIYNFNGSAKLVGTFDRENTIILDNGRVAVAFKDARIEQCEYKWVGQNPVKYVSDTETVSDEPVKSDEAAYCQGASTAQIKSNLESAAKRISSEIKDILLCIIRDHADDFSEEGEFKVRPGFGPDKFYLDSVNGSYEMSLFNLIHHIMHERKLYDLVLNDKQLNAVKTLVESDPDSIYSPMEDDFDEYEDYEKIDDLLRSIMSDCARFVCQKLKEFDEEIEDKFADYLEGDFDQVPDDNKHWYLLAIQYGDECEDNDKNKLDFIIQAAGEVFDSMSFLFNGVDAYFTVKKNGSRIAIPLAEKDSQLDDKALSDFRSKLEGMLSSGEVELDYEDAIYCFKANDVAGNLWRNKIDELAGPNLYFPDNPKSVYGFHDAYSDIAYQQWSGSDFDEGIISAPDKEFYYGDKMFDCSFLSRSDFEINISE